MVAVVCAVGWQLPAREREDAEVRALILEMQREIDAADAKHAAALKELAHREADRVRSEIDRTKLEAIQRSIRDGEASGCGRRMGAKREKAEPCNCPPTDALCCPN